MCIHEPHVYVGAVAPLAYGVSNVSIRHGAEFSYLTQSSLMQLLWFMCEKKVHARWIAGGNLRWLDKAKHLTKE